MKKTTNSETPHFKGIFYLLTPGVTLLFIVLVLELFFRIQGIFPEYLSFSNERFYRMVDETAKMYPPSRAFFSMTCKERPPVADQNQRVMNLDLREYEYSLPKPADNYRIIGLGDSFAWGWGIFDNRVTMFKLLECWFQVMKKKYSAIEVINAAQPGAGIEYYQKFVTQMGGPLTPDMYLLVLNLNDIRCYHASVPVEANAYRMFQKNPGRLSRISAFYKWLRYRYLLHKASKFTYEDYQASYFGKKKHLWLETQEMLVSINRYCKDKGITFAVVIFPLLNDLEGDTYPFAKVVKEIEGFLRREHILYLNLLPKFRGKISRRLWVLPADAHPNPVAHRIAAEAMYWWIKKEGLIPLMDFE